MTDNFIKYYQDLPDSMDADNVKLEFEKVLAIRENKDVSVFDICDALYQLADRQYHTYSILDKNTQSKIANWVTANWVNDIRFIQNLGMIAGGIGNKEIVELLKTKIKLNIPAYLKDELLQTITEIEPNIENPYWDLNN